MARLRDRRFDAVCEVEDAIADLRQRLHARPFMKRLGFASELEDQAMRAGIHALRFDDAD
jgi:hypothetical protein